MLLSGVCLSLAACQALRGAPPAGARARAAVLASASFGSRPLQGPRQSQQPPPRPLPYGELVVSILPNGSVVVTGKTYDVKEALKARGFRWRPTERAWALDPEARVPSALVLDDLAKVAAESRLTLRCAGISAKGTSAGVEDASVQPAPLATHTLPAQATQPAAAAATSSSWKAEQTKAVEPRNVQLRSAVPAVAATPLVPARLPTRLSASALSKWRQCPLQFRFVYVDRLPQPPTPEMLVGIATHEALQELLQAGPQDRTLQAALKHVDTAWTKALRSPRHARALEGSDIPAEEWLERARAAVRSYFDIESPEDVRPIGLERRINVDLGPAGARVPFTGILDRVDRDEDAGEGRPGGLVIVDYKTGAAPSVDHYPLATRERILDDHFFQLRLYALLTERDQQVSAGSAASGGAPGAVDGTAAVGETPVRLRLLFLKGSGKALERAFLPGDSDATEAEVLHLAGQIRAAAATHEFPPSTSALCEWCTFKSRCPAYSPDAPELPPPPLAQ